MILLTACYRRLHVSLLAGCNASTVVMRLAGHENRCLMKCMATVVRNPLPSEHVLAGIPEKKLYNCMCTYAAAVHAA